MTRMNSKFGMSIMIMIVLLYSCAENQEELLTLQQEDKFEYFRQSDGLISNEITALYEDKEGNLWIGTAAGISVFDGTSFTNYGARDGLIESSIVAISHDNQGRVWAGSYDGYSVFDGQSWETSYDLGITSFYLDNENTFWLGTFGYGVARWPETGDIDFYTSDTCELCNYNTKIFPDNDGKIWFSTLGAALRFDENKMTSFSPSTGVNEYLTAGASDSWGNIWLGSVEGLDIDRIIGNKVSAVDLPTGYTYVTGMATAKDILYITTEGSGLLYYNGVVMREIVTPDSDYTFYSILADSKGNIWFGTAENGLIRFTPKETL